MVEGLGMHGPDQGDVVGAATDVGQIVGNSDSRFAMLAKPGIAAHQHGRLLLDEGEPDLLQHGLGHGLAVQLRQFRLRIEEVDLAGGAGHEEKNAALGLAREMSGLHLPADGLGGVGLPQESLLGQHRRQGDTAQTAGAAGQEISTRFKNFFVPRAHVLLPSNKFVQVEDSARHRRP